MTHPKASITRRAAVLGGRTGLLGRALVEALDAAGWDAAPLGRQDVDPFDAEALSAVLDELGVDTLFNTVAYTQVDKAESEEQEAFRINRRLPAILARIAGHRGLTLVHYSTDFVFDGRGESPYAVDAPTTPRSVYGKSKLAGEREILSAIPDKALIIRTSWLFGPGKMNFVQRILELCTEREELGVVHDQVGSPTYTPDLAACSVKLLEAGGEGVHHLACAGRASWCELAAEAASLAGMHCRIKPITSDEYPLPAPRPAYSVLDLSRFTELTGVKPRAWATCLRDYVFGDLGYAREDS